MSFVIARQPVFDRNGELFGYEIYLRKSENLDSYPQEVSYNKATFIVAELIAELGLNKVSGGKPIIVNVTLDSILNKSLDLLSLDKVIFSIIRSNVELGKFVINTALKRIDELKSKGGKIAIEEDYYSSKYMDLLKRADIVEFKAENVTEGKIEGAKRNRKLVLLSKIEKREQYEAFRDKADYFEGNLLGKPEVIREIEIAPFLKTTLMRMIAAMNTAQSIRDFAKIIESDVGMSVKLLRFVNSGFFAPRKEIKDIVQACSYLGMENLKKFTLLMAANDYVAVEDSTLWKKSLIRAFVAEELAYRINPQIASKAYLAGLFSLIDDILGVDKIQFLKEINIDPEIIDAYTGKNLVLSRILREAEVIEENYWFGNERFTEAIREVARKLGINEELLRARIVDAVKKAEEILKL